MPVRRQIIFYQYNNTDSSVLELTEYQPIVRVYVYNTLRFKGWSVYTPTFGAKKMLWKMGMLLGDFKTYDSKTTNSALYFCRFFLSPFDASWTEILAIILNISLFGEKTIFTALGWLQLA